MEPSQLIVIGSLNTDLVMKSERLPQPGETILGGSFFQALGGKGTNQAVAAARYSTEPVYFIAAIGNDAFGNEARFQLQQENLDCTYLKTIDHEPSGIAMILVDEQGENCISVAPGANKFLNPADVSSLPDALFASALVLLVSMEIPLETVRAALAKAKQFQLQTVLNPAPANRLIVDAEFLSLVDLLTPNETELAILTGNSCETTEAKFHAMQTLQSQGCSQVIVTEGSSGIHFLNGDQLVSLPAISVEAVDTTAAGDAFNGVLAGAMAEGLSFRKACQRAILAAGLSVTKLGAIPSLPSREEILLQENGS